jgi:thiamine-phosphate pyrophosphorylase
MNLGELYFITDSGLSKQGIIEDVKQAIAAGVRVVQYREKNKPLLEMQEEAIKLKKICQENNVLFLVNDHLELALEIDADGMHVGQKDTALIKARKSLPNKIIGVSAGSLEQALQAEQHGANYLGVGPIFATDTKKDAGPPVGLETLKQIKEQVKIPLVAIGGINQENFKDVVKAGADSLAMISAVVGKPNVSQEVTAIITAVKEIRSEV